MSGWWRRAKAMAVAALVVGLVGCAAGAARNSVPPTLEDAAQVASIDTATIRFWGDELPANAAALSQERWSQIRARQRTRFAAPTPVMYSLALSGGGSYGAFGAGLLSGWTASGTRPRFDLVTGVSTGALIAPFAFLGPKYDPALREVFTQVDTGDIAILRPVRGLLSGSSLASNAPLAEVIARYVTPSFLAEVATEHRKGRRLLIGTTNLDAERPVIWDMGAIAASGSPEAGSLFQRILLASAAIPGVFPPQMIKVSANGQAFEEMHVDGGTTREVFLVPTQFMTSSVDNVIGKKVRRRTYIIRNGYVTPQYKSVNKRTMSIAGRAVSTLIKSQGVGDLYQLYLFCKKNGIDYNLAYIPEDLQDTSDEAFDPVFMGKLFDTAYNMAARGYPWRKSPPHFGQ